MKIIREVCCKDRVLQLIGSIPDPFIKIESADKYKSWLIFGHKDGVVIYKYKICNSCLNEWIEDIKELGFIYKEQNKEFIPKNPVINYNNNLMQEKIKSILLDAINSLTK